MQLYTDCIEYWRLIVRQKSSVLMREKKKKKKKKKLAITIGNYSSHFSTIDDSITRLKIDKVDHKAAKTTSVQLRKEFLNKYITR